MTTVTVHEAYNRKLWQSKLLRFRDIPINKIVLSEWGYILYCDEDSRAARADWMLSVASKQPAPDVFATTPSLSDLQTDNARLLAENAALRAALNGRTHPPSFASRLKARRLECGLTQDQIALAAGISQPAYYAYEHGERSPRLDTVIRIAGVLGVTLGALVGE